MNAHRMKIVAVAALLSVLTTFGWAGALPGRPAIRYYFKTLDIKNGLSHNTVNAILQDRSGFMWFGTKDGLNRFDGLSFRIFRKDDNGLGNSFITALHEDEEGKIWVGTDAGVYVYDPREETFSPFPLVARGVDKPERAVTLIGSDEAGRIWISMDYRGLFRYDRATGELLNLLPSGPESGEKPMGAESEGEEMSDAPASRAWRPNVTRFWFDPGTVWVSLYDDNLYFTADTFRTLVPFRGADGSEPFRGDIINARVAGPHNCWYIGSSNGLTEINRTTGAARRLLDAYVRDLCFKSDEELWVGTESGLYICDLAAGRARPAGSSRAGGEGNTSGRLAKTSVTHLAAPRDNDPYALADNALYALTRDREGGMWIGSYFGGVNYYPRPWAYFEKFYPRDDLDRFGRRVREFAEGDDGIIWIGTEDKGLFRFDTSSGRIEPFLEGEIYHNIHGLCPDGPYLWVGTFSDGLYRINLRTRERRRYGRPVPDAAAAGRFLPAEAAFPARAVPDTASSVARAGSAAALPATCSLDANDVFSVCKTSSGNLLAGTTSGLFRYDRAADCFRRIPELGNVFVYDVLEDGGGNLWLATYSDGVYRYEVTKKQWKNFRSHAGDTTSLPYDKVISLYEDRAGRLWVMTEGGGFCRFDAAAEQFVRYDRSKGFSHPIVYRMVEDEEGNLWLTTNNGLVCFHPDTGRERVYTTADGLLSNQFNYQSGLKDRQGRLYLGSINGFITFDPATFGENRFVPPVVLTDFFLFNKRVAVGGEGSPLKQSIVFSDRVELDADQHSFSLHAAALSFQAPEMNRLTYKLEGFDKEWYAVGRSGLVSYSNLPYGSYTFRLKGSNSDGRWNDEERRLEIRIRPPFYLSGWARAAYVLLALGAAAGAAVYIRRRSAWKHRRAMERFEREKERELYTAKIDFFTNVAHEIRTPLTLIKSPLENVLASRAVGPEVRDDLEIMSLNTHRLLDLVNQLLDFRKTETRGLRLRFARTEVSELLQHTFLRFTLSARQRGLRFTLDRPKEVWARVDREALTKIVSNLFSNAVKYAATYIRVELSVCGERLVLSVCNDGTPVPAGMREEIFKPFIQYEAGGARTTSGTGIGLALARSLTELHGGTLRMEEAGEENCFRLTLPLKREAPAEGGAGSASEEVSGGCISEGEISGEFVSGGRVSEGETSGEFVSGGKVSEGETSGEFVSGGCISEGKISGELASEGCISKGKISGEFVSEGYISEGETSGEFISEEYASKAEISPQTKTDNEMPPEYAPGKAVPGADPGRETGGESPALHPAPRYAVLVVEDNPQMQTFVVRQLSPLYQVWTAADGAEALEILSTHTVNLVVSDVMMPRMDGLELCDRVKANLEFSHIPVILLTAKTTLQAKIDGMKSGADAYVEKPFSVEYLKVCIANLLSGREKLRAAFAHSPFVPTHAMAMTKADEAFLHSLREVVATHMEDPDFCLDDMAAALMMSRSSLNRKIKGVLDLTPNDYIRLERLKKAAQLLKEGTGKVNEICYRVGFNTPSYFTKCFQKQFGVLPKDFMK